MELFSYAASRPLWLEAVGVVQPPVADGVGLGGIPDAGMPVRRRELAGDQSRAALGAVLDNLGEVAPLGIAQGGKQPVVDREQVQFGEAGEQPCEGAVAAPDGQLMEQARHTEVARREAAATRPLDEGTGEEALAEAGGAGDQ